MVEIKLCGIWHINNNRTVTSDKCNNLRPQPFNQGRYKFIASLLLIIYFAEFYHMYTSEEIVHHSTYLAKDSVLLSEFLVIFSFKSGMVNCKQIKQNTFK